MDLFAEWDSPEFARAMESVIDAGGSDDVPVGTLVTDLEYISDRVQQGFDFLIAGKDVSLLMESIEEAIDRYEAVSQNVVTADDN